MCRAPSFASPLLALSLLFVSAAAWADAEPPALLRSPALSRTEICFSFAGDLWTVPREGGEAKRLTTGTGNETDPHYSPDGQWIAFTGEYDGNVDAYVVPSEGGVPRRLTYHPVADEVVGWTGDGKAVLFRSGRESYASFQRLFTIPLEGGFPTALPLPTGTEGSYSPDGKRLAYVPIRQTQRAWKRYRGGRTKPVWIADLATSAVEKVPRENSNDFNPMWVGQKVYFLSDRNGPITLFRYDTGSHKVEQALKNDGLDLKSACAGPGGIVYEQFGALALFDPATGASRPVPVRLAADLPEVRPHFVKAAPYLQAARLSPTGARAAFEARGEILTVPAEKGDARNLTNTPGIAERDPSWSPDGQRVAYFSDESGEYALHVRAQNGMGEVTKIDLGQPPSFFYSPTWSPDGKKIAYTDKRLNYWYVDLETKQRVKFDTNPYDSAMGGVICSWSPDSRWIAYGRQLRNYLTGVFLYSLETKTVTQVTDGMSEARFPVFDRGGKYLYLASSTDIGLTIQGLDMSSQMRPVTRNVYVVVLRKDLPSPLAPESDEEKEPAKPEDGKRLDAEKKAEPTRIDLDGLTQRIVALPIPAQNYTDLRAGKEGVLILASLPVVPADLNNGDPQTLSRFDLATRKFSTLVGSVGSYDVAANGEKLLYQTYRQPEAWAIAPTTGLQPGQGALKMGEVEVYVEPRAEWRQIYREVWRIERDFFYDPGYHGLDIAAAEKEYAPWLERLASRADLTYLFEEMLGEFTVGHMYIGGGDIPRARRVACGLLGADYAVENGRYRITRVYSGESWNPQLRAPMTQPGVNVSAGEYLLAVNGREVTPESEVYRYFEGTAGKQTVLKVGPNADGSGAREVTVVPTEQEFPLRRIAWIEENRRKVDRMSGGKLAYVYLPDTGYSGYASFNRYYFAQTDRAGAVIDERYNGGGQLADYIIDYLRRPLMSRVMTREGADYNSPMAAIYGPKAMIINESAGSGGDALPWYFRKAGIGPLIGKRTWGGLVGIGDYPPLLDNGSVTAPRMAIYGLQGEYEVENAGIAPDIEVEMDPAAWRQGHDPQLEKAVEVVMEELRKHPAPEYKRPKYPNYHPRPRAAARSVP